MLASHFDWVVWWLSRCTVEGVPSRHWAAPGDLRAIPGASTVLVGLAERRRLVSATANGTVEAKPSQESPRHQKRDLTQEEREKNHHAAQRHTRRFCIVPRSRGRLQLSRGEDSSRGPVERRAPFILCGLAVSSTTLPSGPPSFRRPRRSRTGSGSAGKVARQEILVGPTDPMQVMALGEAQNTPSIHTRS